MQALADMVKAHFPQLQPAGPAVLPETHINNHASPGVLYELVC